MQPSDRRAVTRRAVLAACGTAMIAGCANRDRNGSTPNATPEGADGQKTPRNASTQTNTQSAETTDTDSPRTRSTSTPVSIGSVAGEWSHPEHDAGGTRYASETTGPAATPQTAWRVESAGVVGFAIAESRLFLVRTDSCVALDATSGESVWSVDLPSTTMPATATVESPPGPVYADETVFVAAGSELRALRADDGSERWTVSLPPGPVLDLAVADGQAYVTTGETGSGDSGHLTAVATADGSERWRMAADQVRQPAGTLASAVAVEDTTVGGISARSDGSYTVNFALDKTDGTERWVSTGRNHGGALTVANDRVYTGGFQGYVGPQDAASGERIWEVNIGPPVNTIALDDERVYVSSTPVSGAQVSAFSLSGEEQWTADGGGTLAVADAVYLAQPSATTAFNRTDGTVRWTLPRPSEVNPVGLAVVDSVLFEATENAVRALVST